MWRRTSRTDLRTATTTCRRPEGEAKQPRRWRLSDDVAATGGICIYDATNGSLRLTQMLGAHFAQVVDRAIVITEERSESLGTLTELRALAALVATLQQVGVYGGTEFPLQDTEWIWVVAAGQRAVHSSPDGALEVTVIGHRDTPHGLMYDLAPVKPGTRWLVIATDIRPINGQTATALAQSVMAFRSGLVYLVDRL